MTAFVPAELLSLDAECYPHNPLTPNQWARVLSSDRFVVQSARCEGVRVGYVLGKWGVESGRRVCKIQRLGVSESCRRLGLARGLLESLGDVDLEMELRETNLAGLSLLRSVGFEALGLDRERFPECDGVVLWRSARGGV
jgi:ribosomal protein S18 acetylase RimI-like enzyme